MARLLPGTRLLRVARVWLPPAYVALVLEPLVADWGHDRRGRQGMDRLRADAAWALALALAFAVGGARAIAQPVPFAVQFEAGTLAAAYTGLGALLMIGIGVAKGQAIVASSLLPSMIAAALLMAPLPVAALLLVSPRTSPRHARMVLVRTVALCVLLVAAGMEWVVPDANQRYRQVLREAYGLPAVSTRGPRELPTSALFDGSRVVVSEAVRIERHQRLAVLLWPPTLAAVRHWTTQGRFS